MNANTANQSPKLSEARAKLVAFKRAKRLSMGGTFLVAVALAVQLSYSGEAAIGILGTTIPVAFVGGALSGWIARPSAGLAMASACAAIFATLGVAQSGSAYTDELLLLAIPFSAAAAIVMGHVRRWPGKAAAALAVILVALAIGTGMTEMPHAFAVAHLAICITLPTIPIPSDP